MEMTGEKFRCVTITPSSPRTLESMPLLISTLLPADLKSRATFKFD